MSSRYDLVVLGGGAAGLIASTVAARVGGRVVLVEQAEQPGGDCLFTGCVPSKSLIASAKLAHSIRTAGPQETAQGTTTRWPVRMLRTRSPMAITSATHSWPIGKGPANGRRPQIQPTTGSTSRAAMPICSARETGRWSGSVSPLQRPATSGRTIASVGEPSASGSRSRHRSRPLRTKTSSRTRLRR